MKNGLNHLVTEHGRTLRQLGPGPGSRPRSPGLSSSC